MADGRWLLVCALWPVAFDLWLVACMACDLWPVTYGL